MDQTCLLIIGMHRSGTSALAGTLQLLGVDLGTDLLNETRENEKGFFENKKLFFINEKILRSIKSSWDDLFYDASKLKGLAETFELEETICKNFKDSKLFAIKDPRLPYLFPIYEKILKKLNITIKIIIPYRSPFEVARSLNKRDAFSLEKGMLLWAYSLLIAEKYSRDYPHVFVSFDDLLYDTEKTIGAICERLEINLLEKFHSSSDLVNDFLEHRLKHHNISTDDHFENSDIPKVISDIIQIENNFYSDRGKKKFDQIRKELFDYKNFFYCKELKEIDDALKLKTTKLETCRQDLEKCNIDLDRSRREVERCSRQMSRLETSLQEKEGELSTLIENNSSIKSEMLHKESKIDSLGREVDILNAENDALKNELIVLYTSKSWKLTRPLRKLRKLFG